mmetsp:Transcript_3021/g.7266  ORF Transcript_3021/g.7266 Transcript_3021/m.7266 type:complete len:202 (-) Transcript_3021:416-1021(-)
MWHPISVPVLPSPARQWTATTPPSPTESTMSRNLRTVSPDGAVQSSNSTAWCRMGGSSRLKTLSSYMAFSFSRTTSVTPRSRKCPTCPAADLKTTCLSTSSSSTPSVWSLGPAKATKRGLMRFRSHSKLSYSRSYSETWKLRGSIQPRDMACRRPFRQSRTERWYEGSSHVASRKGTTGRSTMRSKRATASSGVMENSSMR